MSKLVTKTEPESQEGPNNKPSSSPRRIAASRANGAMSHGPLTPETKAISAANAIIKHGMLAQTVVLPSESKQRFDQLVEQLLDEHQPLTRSELDLVENMAVARWRQMRTWSIQRNDLAREIVKHEKSASAPAAAAIAFRALSDQSTSFSNAHRYETAYTNQYKSALRELRNLKNNRDSSVETVSLSSSADSSTWDADTLNDQIANQNVEFRREPSPISEHPAQQEAMEPPHETL